MKIETEVELTMTEEQKYMLWGIMHHHLTMPKLDAHEVAFRNEVIMLIDPDKEYESAYMKKPQAR